MAKTFIWAPTRLSNMAKTFTEDTQCVYDGRQKSFDQRAQTNSTGHGTGGRSISSVFVKKP
jgi:hypothetical protein